MQKNNLMLHCGGYEVTEQDVRNAITPAPLNRWHPNTAPHRPWTLVTTTLETTGVKIIDQKHALARGGDRYFGLMQVAYGANMEAGVIVGVRNAHDKSFPASLVLGQQVFVCDNLVRRMVQLLESCKTMKINLL